MSRRQIERRQPRDSPLLPFVLISGRVSSDWAIFWSILAATAVPFVGSTCLALAANFPAQLCVISVVGTSFKIVRIRVAWTAGCIDVNSASSAPVTGAYSRHRDRFNCKHEENALNGKGGRHERGLLSETQSTPLKIVVGSKNLPLNYVTKVI